MGIFSALLRIIKASCNVSFPAGAWSFSVSELAAPGVEVGRLTASDPDLGENALLEFTIMDSEEAEIFNLTKKGDNEAVIVLSKVIIQRQEELTSCVFLTVLN